MSYAFVNVKTYKRGASWPDGEARMCTQCHYEGGRRRRAVLVAEMKYSGDKYKLPVAYCDRHIPGLITGVLEGGNNDATD